MERVQASLVNLPAEILSHIIDYVTPSVLPHGQTFRIKRAHLSQPRITIPDKYARSERDFYSWTTKKNEPWEVGRAVVCPQVLALLLIHPVWYQSILPRLYSDNTLWFPDPHTLHQFTQRFSPQAKAAIRTLSLSACGEVLSFHGLNTRVYHFEYSPHIDIADTIAEFPNLKDLRLLGVGPGLYQRALCSNVPTPGVTNPGPDGKVHKFVVPPGPYRLQNGEDDRYWSLDAIEVVSQIVGSAFKLADAASQCSKTPRLHSDNASGTSHPLLGGRVFCRRPEERHRDGGLTSGFTSRGRARHMGTRIVARCEQVEIGEEEIELVDVAAALEQARIEDDNKREYEVRKQAGLFPKRRFVRGGYN